MSSTTSGGSTTADMSEDVWLFGYGSIMWKTGFDFEEARLAQIHGWSRRFWQGSGDHRGTPAAPGRVVTLIESYGEICHGMAYRLHGLKVTAILEELDYREKNGYERVDLAIGFADGSQVRGITYHATPDNP
ncbi:MAG: gamma-glutamylcyclotransferase, partial [Proteobacteria bacterium]|nr:gamma-glutamylcyclotransferase [Pseudomonadota bacterium]